MKKDEKPRRLAGLYDPYLDVMGGGEKHILSILKALEEKGYEIHIFWDENVSGKIREVLDVHFSKEIIYHPNIFKHPVSFIKKYLLLRNFDLFFYMTDGSYFFSGAKETYVFAMVPNKGLYEMDIINRIKTSTFRFISNSHFTQNHLKKWGIPSTVIYPYIDQDNGSVPKEKTILTVGRFFKHLHSKRQDMAIKAFRELKKNSMFQDYTLILAGGLKQEDKSYMQELRQLAGNDPSIIFKTNVSHEELLNLYKTSQFYWHFAGYEIDEENNPELVEHLGISPLEAMAHGCVTFCYKAGGPREIIRHGQNGFLFENTTELLQMMNPIMTAQDLKEKVVRQARNFVRENFSYETFKKNVVSILSL